MPKCKRGNVYDAKERFWYYVDKKTKDECWEWKAALNIRGYGKYTIHHNERTVASHRYSWEISNGEIPDGLWVLHKCDNRKCVNPNHLYLGTGKDNVRDRQERNPLINETHGMTKLSNMDVLEIRELYESGGYSQSLLSIKFGVSQAHISRIILRKNRNFPDVAKAIERIVSGAQIIRR